MNLVDQNIPFVMKVKNSAGEYVKNSEGNHEERILKLKYSGCKGNTVKYSGQEPTYFTFFVDSTPISQMNTFYIDNFTSADPRCLLTFTKLTVSGVTDATLDSII